MNTITLNKEQVEAVAKGVKAGLNTIEIDELQIDVEYDEGRFYWLFGWQYQYPLEDWVEADIDEESINKVKECITN